MTISKIIVLFALYITALSARAELPVTTGVTLMPFQVTSSTFDISTNGINTCKEDIKQVEADAHDFLAGEPMTAALEEQIEKVRELERSLAEASDEEVVIEMLKTINE